MRDALRSPRWIFSGPGPTQVLALVLFFLLPRYWTVIVPGGKVGCRVLLFPECNASVTGGYRPAWFCGDQAKAASAPPHSTGCRVLRRHAKLENALAVACPLECGGEDAALVCPGRSIARCGGLRSEPTPCNWALPRNPDYALTNARPYVRMLRTVNDPTIGPGFRASFRVIDEGK